MASKPISKGGRHAFAGLALVVMAMAPIAAKADSIFDLFSSSVNPSDVQYNLARAGFVARSAMVRRGDVYLYDVTDRYGVLQRLIIDTRTGRIVERFSLRPSQWAEARRADVRPRVADDSDDDWDGLPRPQVDVPMARPHVVEALPGEVAPAPRPWRPRDFAYGDGHMATPTVIMPLPDPRPVEKPRPRIARPKPIASPASGESSQTATAAPTATEPVAAPQPATPQVAAPVITKVAPAPQQPAAAEPAAAPTKSVVATTEAAQAKAPVAPPPAPAPAVKSKAINDIPVAPLD